MPALSFDHAHYRCSDVQKTLDFYVGIMEAVDLGTVELLGEPNLQLALGGVTLLFASAGDDPAAPVPATCRLGAYHIAFLVADCDAATEYYSERAARLFNSKIVARESFSAAPNIRASFLSAPDGMWVELKQFLREPDS